MKQILKMILALSFLGLVFFASQAQAKNNYIYRNRINWVKLDDLSKKQLAGVELLHPNATITAVQMEAMLKSIQMNRGSALKNDIKTIEVFDNDEAAKFAPFIVQALSTAQPNQIVNISIVHKRPQMVVRSDHLSMINVFVTREGVHFYFGKLFAKLDGDYMEVSKMDQTIRNAKSMRVALSASEGQQLAFGSEEELVLDPNFDFVNNVDKAEVLSATKPLAKTTTQSSSTKSAEATPQAETVEERLQKLTELKHKGLISDQDYKTKKKEILDEI